MQNPRGTGALPGILGLGQSTAVNIYNAFFLFSFLTPILFALVADLWLGRFKTLMVGLGQVTDTHWHLKKPLLTLLAQLVPRWMRDSDYDGSTLGHRPRSGTRGLRRLPDSHRAGSRGRKGHFLCLARWVTISVPFAIPRLAQRSGGIKCSTMLTP